MCNKDTYPPVVPPKSKVTLCPSACQACGQKSQAGMRFCSNCGHDFRGDPEPAAEPLPQAPAEAETPAAPKEPATPPTPKAADAPVTAPKSCCCGRALPEDADYCPKCGIQVSRRIPKRQLVCEANGQRLGVVELDGTDVTIGKGEENRVVIPNDDYVSRRHARIVEMDGILLLDDLGSSNGTFVRHCRQVALDVGDEILIGMTLMRLEETD